MKSSPTIKFFRNALLTEPHSLTAPFSPRRPGAAPVLTLGVRTPIHNEKRGAGFCFVLAFGPCAHFPPRTSPTRLLHDCYKPRFLCDNARKVHALNSRPCAPCCHMRMLGNEDTQTRIENPTVRLCTMRSLLDSTRRIALMAVAPPARPLSSCKSRMYELTFHRSYSPPMICLRRDKWRHPRCRSSKCSPRPLTASRSTGGCQSVTMAPIGCAAALERAIRTTVPARHRLNFRV